MLNDDVNIKVGDVVKISNLNKDDLFLIIKIVKSKYSNPYYYTFLKNNKKYYGYYYSFAMIKIV